MNEKDILLWSPEYFLSPSDFHAEANPAAFEDAHSFIKYRCTWTVNSEIFGKDIRFTIKNILLTTEFHRHLSWIRLPMVGPKMINHEQGHFDLAESMRHEIMKKMSETLGNTWHPTRGQNAEQRKQFAREDSGVMIHNELAKWEKSLQDASAIYDEKTNYGQIKDKQTEYDDSFKQLRL